MEQAAASTEEINATTQHISGSMKTIVDKAQQGATASAEISGRAVVMKSKASESRRSAGALRESLKEELQQAIEQSKQLVQARRARASR